MFNFLFWKKKKKQKVAEIKYRNFDKTNVIGAELDGRSEIFSQFDGRSVKRARQGSQTCDVRHAKTL